MNAHVDDHWRSYLDLLTQGETVFIKPLRQSLAQEIAGAKSVAARPLLWVAAPIRSTDGGEVVAAISFGIPPEGEFTEILSVARAGDSGETFAFDDEGWLLSDSRFDHQLAATRTAGKHSERQCRAQPSIAKRQWRTDRNRCVCDRSDSGIQTSMSWSI